MVKIRPAVQDDDGLPLPDFPVEQAGVLERDEPLERARCIRPGSRPHG
ncbi:hypothetical protein [Allomeiothermus silvanus]|nr:hypothetical protein [Allomeiothermus silvanus]